MKQEEFENASRKDFTQTDAGNWVLSRDGFYISYNDFKYIEPFWLAFTAGGPQTCLCVGDEIKKYYNLNGDHRAQFKELADKGLDACLEYFKENQEDICFWSSSLESKS